VVAKIRQVEVPGVDLQVARQVARSAAEAVQAGSLGYTLITAVREARTGGHQESASNR
jgi:TPP-dependent pyruvate/acetoin dehydrogenase alpha subunit